ncbi:M48 family metalloprotease [Nitratireductor sp. ZSWI3]|uniref:M48 family metalloprotease n=1 Tax=Nitratireductor sp. ZSWI3 TaxID=2966359 RepID=UPI002150102D|nr:M48 family metalloprotease [Nitratireductor sp. ZSWI3]MCR4266484.1 M48 family metalloprotease [Nitratireductor sp. ZSWI3]
MFAERFISGAVSTRIAALLLITAHFVVLSVPPAAAQRRVAVVRDAEIEALVLDYAQPILKAAGLSRSGIDIILVNNRSFNAFVAGRRIFIHTGTLMEAETPNEIIGVIAHETGHIAGGHQERLRQQIERAQTMAVVSALLGIGAGVAGAASKTSGLAQAGVGLAAGGAEMARRGLLGYQRSEEATADRTAIDYLNKTGQSAKGMLTTFERLAGGLALAGVNVDPYQISHPLPRERIANLEELARKSRYFDRKDPPELQLRHDMMRAKIAAYTEGANAASRLFRSDPGGIPARYGSAIATYLYGNPRDALKKADALIAALPRNPYLHELRGDILIKLNRAEDGANAYAKALSLAPGTPGLLQVGYGQALMATGKPDLVRKAASELQTGLSREPEFANGYRYLAQAYGQLGDVAAAELATAEGHFHSGQYRDAKLFAIRAQKRLKPGSPGWLRAQDIIQYKQPGERS